MSQQPHLTQIMINDLNRGTCPAKKIVCIVVDEAHKCGGCMSTPAQTLTHVRQGAWPAGILHGGGGHDAGVAAVPRAGTERHARGQSVGRPGSHQQLGAAHVCTQRMGTDTWQRIAHIELRNEESADIRPYVHGRDVGCAIVLLCMIKSSADQVEVVVVPLGTDLTDIKACRYIA